MNLCLSIILFSVIAFVSISPYYICHVAGQSIPSNKNNLLKIKKKSAILCVMGEAVLRNSGAQNSGSNLANSSIQVAEDEILLWS